MTERLRNALRIGNWSDCGTSVSPNVKWNRSVARQELPEHLPLRHLSAEQASVELERPVGLRVQRVAVEDDELRVDPAAAERLHVRPRHTRRVDRAVDDAERAASHRAPGAVPGED